MRREKSCGTVAFRRDPELRYLLLHYTAGHWDFPKGHVEPKETEEQTALRELREETSISGTIVPRFRQPIHYFFRQAGELISKDVIFFLAEVQSEKVIISNEHQGFAWLPYEKAREKLTFKNAKEILKKAHAFLQRPE